MSTEWVLEHLDDSETRIVEVSSNSQAYDKVGHIAGAVFWDWRKDLDLSTSEPNIAKSQLEELLARTGVTKATKLVLYGDRENLVATHAFLQLHLYGFKSLLMEGGRERWIADQKPLTKTALTYPRTQIVLPEVSNVVASPLKERLLAQRNVLSRLLLSQDTLSLRDRERQEAGYRSRWLFAFLRGTNIRTRRFSKTTQRNRSTRRSVGMPTNRGIPKSLFAEINRAKARLSSLEKPKALLPELGNPKTRLGYPEEGHVSASKQLKGISEGLKRQESTIARLGKKPAKKEKRKPSEYNLFLKDKMSAGMSMLDAVKAWKEKEGGASAIEETRSAIEVDAYSESPSVDIDRLSIPTDASGSTRRLLPIMGEVHVPTPMMAYAVNEVNVFLKGEVGEDETKVISKEVRERLRLAVEQQEPIVVVPQGKDFEISPERALLTVPHQGTSSLATFQVTPHHQEECTTKLLVLFYQREKLLRKANADITVSRKPMTAQRQTVVIGPFSIWI